MQKFVAQTPTSAVDQRPDQYQWNEASSTPQRDPRQVCRVLGRFVRVGVHDADSPPDHGRGTDSGVNHLVAFVHVVRLGGDARTQAPRPWCNFFRNHVVLDHVEDRQSIMRIFLEHADIIWGPCVCTCFRSLQKREQIQTTLRGRVLDVLLRCLHDVTPNLRRLFSTVFLAVSVCGQAVLRPFLIEALLGKSKLSFARAASSSSLLNAPERLSATLSRV